jgi:superfamily II DNA or RNA helicase
MQLRTYQQDAIDAVKTAWQAGSRDTLLVAATGAGKTQMFLRLLMDELDSCGGRGLIVAHRQELIDQPLQRIGQMDPDWLMAGVLDRPRVGILMAEHNDTDRQLTIATVQTLASPKRRAALVAAGPITHLVIDECHHATAPTYVTLWEELRAANASLRHLGVTATPMRADGDGLSRVYAHVAAKITIADLVKTGYLVQPRWLAISTGISIAGVASRQGDFVARDLAGRFDTPEGRRIIVQAYQEYAADRRAIAFTASVAGAHDLAADLNAAGIRAVAVDGTTPKDVRARLTAAFRRGEYQVLTNCQVATEGFDAPGTSCILMCRPTRSDSLYVQCMGRGLRPALGMAQEGEDCLILDFVPLEARNIVMAGDVLGLPKETTRVVLDEQRAAEPGAVQAGFTFDGERFDSNGTPMEIIARRLNYLDQSPYHWHDRGGMLTLGLGPASDGIERILVMRDGTLYGVWRNRERTDHWTAQPIPCDDPYARAQELADKWASQQLATKGRAWHTAPASEGQTSWLSRLARGEIKRRDLEVMTKRDAADLITFYQARQALARWDAAYSAGVVEVAP